MPQSVTIGALGAVIAFAAITMTAVIQTLDFSAFFAVVPFNQRPEPPLPVINPELPPTVAASGKHVWTLLFPVII